MRLFILWLAAFAVSSCSNVVPSLSSGAKPGLYQGVYQKGQNITEPRPQRSKYLQTVAGGAAVMSKGAGLFLTVKVIEPPSKDLYFTVEYENPGGSPLRNDASFAKGDRSFTFSVPTFQSGLRAYQDYTIKVRVWNSKGDREPIDTLTQKVRCYVDTTGPSIRVLDSMKTR